MASPVKRSVIETRYDQMFPILPPEEIERLRHFGDTRTYEAGTRVVTAGEPSPGIIVVLRGELAVDAAQTSSAAISRS
jgi:thioredoxin reductase (NADPH)